jgi:hypothetical protein
MIMNFEYSDVPSGVKIVLPSLGNKSSVFEGISIEQFANGVRIYNEGALMQRAFSFLNADQREFLMTGTTSEEWDALFSEED